MSRLGRGLPAAIALAVFLMGCAAQVHRTMIPASRAAGRIDPRQPFLKAHYRDGRLCVFDSWVLVESGRVIARGDSSGVTDLSGGSRKADRTLLTIRGRGDLYDPSRTIIRHGEIEASLDSIALFETNQPTNELPTFIVAVLLIVGVSVLVLAIYCASNPKACYGSCPTFYLDDGQRPVLMAEGFSSSVAPALEATDVDALFRARPHGRVVDMEMRNEALETQVVRSVHVLAAPRTPGTRVFHAAGGGFWEAREVAGPVVARAPEGDCAAQLAAFDDLARSSRADSTDLATRETIDLVFPPGPTGRYGLVLAARQSLLTTYLFYQTLAYMGSHAGDYLTKLDGPDPTLRSRADAIGRELGHIEVQARDTNGAWRTVGDAGETGPLATDVVVVPLPGETSPAELRLRLTRGAWRLDWACLVRLEHTVQPTRVSLESVSKLPDSTATPAAVVDPPSQDAPLVTTRGDRYALRFRLPGDASGYELFLESRGYYLEWMRDEWLAEENASLAHEVFVNPRGTLRRLAPEFKRQEDQMEKLFWSSRYAVP